MSPTEVAEPTVALLALLALGSAIAWVTHRSVLALVAGFLFGLLIPGAYFLDWLVVTERERVEESVRSVARAFQQRKEAETLSHFSSTAPALHLLVKGGFALVEVRDDLLVKDLTVTLSQNDTRAVTIFRANASLHVKGHGDVGFQPSRWNVKWQKERAPDADPKLPADRAPTVWRIIEVQRMHPLENRELPALEQSRG